MYYKVERRSNENLVICLPWVERKKKGNRSKEFSFAQRIPPYGLPDLKIVIWTLKYRKSFLTIQCTWPYDSNFHHCFNESLLESYSLSSWISQKFSSRLGSVYWHVIWSVNSTLAPWNYCFITGMLLKRLWVVWKGCILIWYSHNVTKKHRYCKILQNH